jgi:hypothetical protein
MAKNGDVDRTIGHVVCAANSAEQSNQPFLHLLLAKVFPADIYSAILDAMPAKEDYRVMSGRTKSTRTNDGGTRTKIDLFPEFIHHLPKAKRYVWEVAGKTLTFKEVQEAFRQRLTPGLSSSDLGRTT